MHMYNINLYDSKSILYVSAPAKLGPVPSGSGSGPGPGKIGSVTCSTPDCPLVGSVSLEAFCFADLLLRPGRVLGIRNEMRTGQVFRRLHSFRSYTSQRVRVGKAVWVLEVTELRGGYTARGYKEGTRHIEYFPMHQSPTSNPYPAAPGYNLQLHFTVKTQERLAACAQTRRVVLQRYIMFLLLSRILMYEDLRNRFGFYT